jgi:tape measure domain-containing protein
VSYSIGFDIFARDRASQTMDNVGNHTEAMGHKFSAMKVAAVASVAVTGAALLGFGASAVKAGVQTAASMEQANIAFTSLLGSGAKSQAFLDKLGKFAAATPFELPGLIDASRQLIGVGQSADSVIPTLTAFGDASGALGLSQDNFNHIMMATTQAMSAGTLHAGDLLQMTEAGLPVWKLMSEALGKPVATLKTMSEKGQLLTKDVMPKLQAQMEKDYGGSMAKQSQTLTGLWSTLMDTFHQGMAKAIIPMEPMLRSMIPTAANVMGGALAALGSGANNFFNGVSGHVKRMSQSDRPKLELFGLGLRAMVGAFKSGDVTSKGFIGAMEKVGVAVRKIAGFLSGVFATAMTWIRANGPTIFSGLGQAVSNLASVAVPLLIQAWNAFREPLQKTVQFIVTNAIPAIVSITGWMSKHATLVQAVAVGIGTIVVALKVWALVTKTMAVAQGILNAVMAANPIGIVILAIVGLAAAFVYAYKHSETFRNIVTGVFNAVKNVIMGVYNWVRSNWPLLLAILTGPIGIAVLVVVRNFDTIKGAASGAVKWVTDRFDSIIGFFTKMPGRIASAASGMWHGVTDAFKSAINSIISGWNSLQFSIHIPKVHIPGTNSNIGGGDIGFGVPSIPFLAKGGDILRGGEVIVGDAGPERLTVPTGARVAPLDNRTKDHTGGDTTINLNFHGPVIGSSAEFQRAVAGALEEYVGNGGTIKIAAGTR